MGQNMLNVFIQTGYIFKYDFFPPLVFFKHRGSSHYILLVVCVSKKRKRSLKCEWNNFFITVLTCKFMEVSSEILSTLLGSGILQVTSLDGSVKYLRGRIALSLLGKN